jgi:centromere protein C
LQRRIETTSMPKMASLSPMGMAAPTSAKMPYPIQGTAKRGSTKKVSSDPEETESPVPERRSAAAKILTSEPVRKTTSVTPNKASPLRRTTARKLEATQKKLESTNMRTPEVSKKRKAKVMFSPPGYPINNREMNPVPVSDFKESPEHGKRRSRRMHVKPLAFWKNERIVYGPHNEKGLLGEMMGSMPVPQNVLTALPTPRKQRKLAPKAARNLKSGIDAQSANHDVKPFDATRLKKKYNFLDGEYAQVWDESIETSTDESKL